jgi:hypothetical protein
MTAKETLDQHIDHRYTDKWPGAVLDAVLIAMERFARTQQRVAVERYKEKEQAKRGHLGACDNKLCPQCGPNIP